MDTSRHSASSIPLARMTEAQPIDGGAGDEFDRRRQALGQLLHDLADGGNATRGPMLPPDLDLMSTASKQLREATKLTSSDVPDPMTMVFAHVERLLLAGDDHLRSVGDLLLADRVPWFGHIPVVRSGVETLSRAWHLTDPAVSSLDRVVRMLNERIYEFNHVHSVLADPACTMPQHLIDGAKAHASKNIRAYNAWAKSHGVPTRGGPLGPGRAGPMALLAQIYDAESGGTPMIQALGLFRYSELSSIAHGLPDGMARYVVDDADDGTDHAHMRMTITELARTIDVLVTVYDAAIMRSGQFFRWPVSPDYELGVGTAVRLQLNRLGELTKP